MIGLIYSNILCPAGNRYRYGFQGQELDNETGFVNYAYRMHDPRIGKFLSIDPIATNFPWNSPYSFSENRVVDGIEFEGLEVVHFQTGNLKTSIDFTKMTNDQIEAKLEATYKYHQGNLDVEDWKKGVKFGLQTASFVIGGLGLAVKGLQAANAVQGMNTAWTLTGLAFTADDMLSLNGETPLQSAVKSQFGEDAVTMLDGAKFVFGMVDMAKGTIELGITLENGDKMLTNWDAMNKVFTDLVIPRAMYLADKTVDAVDAIDKKDKSLSK